VRVPGLTALLVGVLAAGTAIAPAQAAGSLDGAVIVLDPGHQRGNSNPAFSSKVNATRFNGSIVKACNTTGTATNAGFPESTFTWKVANRLKRLLKAQGARVILTRDRESYDAWGPCAWDRARPANAAKADLLVSIHADGAPSGAKGFHVIAPTPIRGYTDDIVRPSRALARSMIAGMREAGATPSTYIDNALSIRGDQSTLNFSDVPSVIVELGNMRNAQEARAMSSAAGQQRYAEQLLAGISRYCAAPSRCR
jgi:N-acetylmuramoyl-L-alanine amidase